MSSIFHLPKFPKPPTAPDVSSQYTPSNWSDKNPALYAITFRDQGSLQQTYSNPFDYGQSTSVVDLVATTDSSRAGYNATTQMNMFVFDALKRAHHKRVATVTQHPLQSGFNISDHVVMQPTQLVLEVGMSDAIASYTVAGYTPMWTINKSKSVSAYQQMEALMTNRVLMTINTRLETYDSMILVDISVEDTARTYFGGLAMVLTFVQVFVADVSISYESARIQASGETTQGTVQPQPPSQTVVDQHKVGWGTPSAPLITVPGIIPGADVLSGLANFFARGGIPGAGLYTSNIMAGLPLGY